LDRGDKEYMQNFVGKPLGKVNFKERKTEGDAKITLSLILGR